MNCTEKAKYTNLLKKELVSAMGCTEPVAVAYASALARKTLGEEPVEVIAEASANIIKNVKSVIVPNTGGLKNLEAAVAAGVSVGDADKELQVLSGVKPTDIPLIHKCLTSVKLTVRESKKPYVFHICIIARSINHEAVCEIAGSHTNVILISKDGNVIFSKEYEEEQNEEDYLSFLSFSGILEYADTVDLADIRETIERQINYNTAIADEGLSGEWGASIGKTILKYCPDDIRARAKAYAAAGSDARMSGCELPVIINSGSGNQGMTCSLPVIVYGRKMGVSQDKIIRALLVSNLVTLHLKSGIGRLSAYCGATSAGSAAASGIAYLHGYSSEIIENTVNNGIAIVSGMVCDGAKSSCAAKVAEAVDAGLVGMYMAVEGNNFNAGDGIVGEDAEETAHNVGIMAKQGMRETDRKIIELMIQ